MELVARTYEIDKFRLQVNTSGHAAIVLVFVNGYLINFFPGQTTYILHRWLNLGKLSLSCSASLAA